MRKCIFIILIFLFCSHCQSHELTSEEPFFELLPNLEASQSIVASEIDFENKLLIAIPLSDFGISEDEIENTDITIVVNSLQTISLNPLESHTSGYNIISFYLFKIFEGAEIDIEIENNNTIRNFKLSPSENQVTVATEI